MRKPARVPLTAITDLISAIRTALAADPIGIELVEEPPENADTPFWRIEPQDMSPGAAPHRADGSFAIIYETTYRGTLPAITEGETMLAELHGRVFRTEAVAISVLSTGVLFGYDPDTRNRTVTFLFSAEFAAPK